MKTLALFDFDGTLYKKDSLLEFTKYAKGHIDFWKGMIVLSPSLVGLKLGFLDNERVKIKFLTYFFSSWTIEEFNTLAQRFAKIKIVQNLNKNNFSSFLKHANSGHTICIVSASCSNWIQPWSDQYGVLFIGSELEVVDQKITGNLATKNCFGAEKVNRIKSLFNLEDYDVVKVYGAGRGDLHMLQLSK